MSAPHHQATRACPRKAVVPWQAVAEPEVELPLYNVTGGLMPLVPVFQLHNSSWVVTITGILTIKPVWKLPVCVRKLVFLVRRASSSLPYLERSHVFIIVIVALASSDFVGAIFLTEASHWGKKNYKYLLRSIKLLQVTDGATWNLARCLGEGQLVAHIISQAMKGTVFPFEIRDNYSPSSGLVEYYMSVCSLSWQTGMKKIFKCRAL